MKQAIEEVISMQEEYILLALETSTSACSAALSMRGKVVERFEIGSNIHSKKLLSMVDSLFIEFDISPTQLDAVIVGQGPGSFTGLRIGVGIGQGIAYAAAKPMIGISSIDAIAHAASPNLKTGQSVLVAMDARMNEVYWAEFMMSKEGILRQSNIAVGSPESIQLEEQPTVIAGNAFQEYKGRFDSRISDLVADVKVELPRAAMLLEPSKEALKRGEIYAAADFAPVYVRNDVAKKPSNLRTP